MLRFCLALCLMLAGPALGDAWRVSGVSTDDRLNVRSGPSTRFDVVTDLPKGFGGLLREVCVLVKPAPDAANRADLPEWCAISQGGAIIGWVNARYLAPDPAVPDELRLMSGFRAYDDPCRIVGESAATVDYLDDTRWLVGCPVGSPGIAEVLGSYGGEEVDRIGGYVLLSVPRGD